jgi:hypothetical protein
MTSAFVERIRHHSTIGHAVAMTSLGAMFDADDSGTFLGLRSASVDDLDDADIVIIGAPCATPYSSVGPYCKNAPAAIRGASATYSGIRHHHNFDLDGPMLLEVLCQWSSVVMIRFRSPSCRRSLRSVH